MTSNRNHSCASFIFIPDADRQTDGQTSTDKGTDESTYKETHRVKSDKHMCVCLCVHGGSDAHVGAGKKTRPPAARPNAPPPPFLLSLMPKAIFSSLCQSIMQVHSTSKGISGDGGVVPEVEP